MLRMISFAVLLFFGSLHAVSVHAEELFLSSLSVIPPPPPASPFFQPEEKGVKLRVGYFSMQGTDSTNPSQLDGYGLDVTTRRSFSSRLALDFNFGAVYLVAHNGSMGLNGVAVPVALNLAAQPFENDIVNLVLFAGPGFNASYSSMEHPTIAPGPNIVNDRWDVISYTYGGQGGVQAGFTLDTVRIDIIGMVAKQKGTQKISTGYYDTTLDIPSYTTRSFGVGLTYVPSVLTIGYSFLKAASTDGNGFKKHLFQISWDDTF